MASRMARTVAGAAIALGTMAGLVGTAGADNIGNEGCTPGYWKNHTSNWEEHEATDSFAAEFGTALAGTKFANITFLEALQGGGGSGVDGARSILLRAAAAAFLNAAHEDVGYPYRRYDDPFNIQSQVKSALLSGNRDTMLTLAAQLDRDNNLGCPLN